ncbi:MAG: 3-deoxy-manno-octulosonate cytidylyltransferase [Nitrospirae bacterium]|nr:3-deoxy-manno-octulosonate cytidylyltransferase [Nitrospirota bacterium]MCL5423275.1 3-deoxy-manno-octulosonate cytidylyltransferase [Nitrospirota bacterium]
MSAVIVIPARYDSTRFPGKPLAPLKGKPVIQHVYENAGDARSAEDVIVATDSETIFEAVLSFGGKAVMTSRDHASGTDRIAEVARSLRCDIIVNVQADEPLVRPEMIDDVIGLLSDDRADIGTLVKEIQNPEEVMDPNVVKAVFGQEGFALYFSRAPIPYHRDEWKDLDRFDVQRSKFNVFKHIGIYSYKRDVLIKLAGMEPSRLEKIEKLEQLRALENGFMIKVKETSSETIGVDTPQDLERVERWLSISS